MGARGKLKLPPNLTLVSSISDAPATAAEQMPPIAPEPPADLPEDLHPLWDELVSSLEEIGLIARCDGPALVLALRHYAVAIKASDELAELESVATYDAKNARHMKHPAHAVFRDHSTAFLEFAKQLGLTFVARARTPQVKDSDGENANPFAAA